MRRNRPPQRPLALRVASFVRHCLAHRSYNQATRQHWGLANAQRMQHQQRVHLDKLLAHVETAGPVKSSDFECKDGGGGAWWGWKDEKLWLEALFATGALMVARQENFHRVYDLSHRVAPDALRAEAAALEAGNQHDAAALHRQFILQSIAALGVTQARWVNDYFRLKPRLKDADLDALEATYNALLPPFDPVVWDRERGSV